MPSQTSLPEIDLQIEMSLEGDLKVLGGVRAFLMSTSSFADLLDDFYLVLGERFVNARLYMGGRRAGARTAAALVSLFKLDPNDKPAVERLLAGVDAAIGWARYEFHLDYAARSGYVIAKNSFLAQGALEKFTANGKMTAVQAKDSFARCAMLAGYLAGLVSYLLQHEVDLQETECLALGHAACRFDVLPHRIYVTEKS